MTGKTAALLTLGCRLNQADSSLLCGRLRKMGFEIVSPDSASSPNLIIVNSCSVTAAAARKSRQALRAIREENPQSFIVMTGCSAVVDKDELNDLADCDLLISNEEKKDIERILPRYLAYLTPDPAKKKNAPPEDQAVFLERASTFVPFKSRAILKIQEGCENFCTYCIVPYSRGRERSRAIAETIEDFRQLVEGGFREIVLSGVNICNYSEGGTNLVGLIERLLAEVPGDYRIRLSSTEPGPVIPELISCMAAHPRRICAFLHLPLQNGSDAILKRMGRKYTTADFESYVKLARASVPNIHIGTDLIVGFPGETAALFEKSCAFVKKIGFSNIHIFPFSPRQGTPAEKMPGRIVGEELDERLKILKELKQESAAAFMKSLLRTRETVLVENKTPTGVCEGWSGNYVKTRFMGPEAEPKTLVDIVFRKILPEGEIAAELAK